MVPDKEILDSGDLQVIINHLSDCMNNSDIIGYTQDMRNDCIIILDNIVSGLMQIFTSHNLQFLTNNMVSNINTAIKDFVETNDEIKLKLKNNKDLVIRLSEDDEVNVIAESFMEYMMMNSLNNNRFRKEIIRINSEPSILSHLDLNWLDSDIDFTDIKMNICIDLWNGILYRGNCYNDAISIISHYMDILINKDVISCDSKENDVKSDLRSTLKSVKQGIIDLILELWIYDIYLNEYNNEKLDSMIDDINKQIEHEKYDCD